MDSLLAEGGGVVTLTDAGIDFKTLDSVNKRCHRFRIAQVHWFTQADLEIFREGFAVDGEHHVLVKFTVSFVCLDMNVLLLAFIQTG